MLISFDELLSDPGKSPAVAIIGTGPAGMTLAMALAEQGIASLLVEAGGLRPASGDNADGYLGESGPRPYPLGASRLRYFGGTSGHWGGWCRPLDPVDFEPVPGVPLTGWPIAWDEAYRHMARAHEILEIPEGRYEDDASLAAATESALALPADGSFRTVAFRFSPPTRFGTRYRPDIESSPLIHCVLNTTLTLVERGPDGRSVLKLRHRDGRETTVGAKFSVLAMGGIENARLLMWSRRMSRYDYGGAGDWLGRCFVDHFGMTVAKFITRPGLNYTRRASSDGYVMAQIVPKPERVARGETSNHMISLTPSDDNSLLQPEYGANPLLFGEDAGRLQPYVAVAVSGQHPNPESRILLEGGLDANGVSRIKVDWRVDDAAFQAVLDSLEQLGRELSGASLARMRKQQFRLRLPTEPLSTGMHHLGTTRMASSEQEGAVDIHGKVFGTDDLYVAGSSLFPTSGYANPTLTIVSLALRLAEHLGGRLSGDSK